jgi:hypothetical protein
MGNVLGGYKSHCLSILGEEILGGRSGIKCLRVAVTSSDMGKIILTKWLLAYAESHDSQRDQSQSWDRRQRRKSDEMVTETSGLLPP